MAFIEFTANPKKKRTNDCIVRSIANATNRPWADVMRELCDLAIEFCTMPNDGEVVDEYMYRRRWFADQPKTPTTVAQFAAEHPQGRFVIGVKDHGVSIIDGDWYDLVDSGRDLVVDYYEVKEEA